MKGTVFLYPALPWVRNMPIIDLTRVDGSGVVSWIVWAESFSGELLLHDPVGTTLLLGVVSALGVEGVRAANQELLRGEPGEHADEVLTVILEKKQVRQWKILIHFSGFYWYTSHSTLWFLSYFGPINTQFLNLIVF